MAGWNEKIEGMKQRMMSAAVLYGREDLRLEEVAVPVAGPGEVVLRVGCGVDVWDGSQGVSAGIPRDDAEAADAVRA